MPKRLALTLLLSTAAAAQQQVPDMPGMNMPGTPAPQKPGKPQPTPNKTPNPAVPEAPDLQHPGPNRRSQAAAQSERNSIQQQVAQPATQPASTADQRSITVPILGVQEPEALDFRTGADLPAPELLTDVVPREPLTLEHFIALADRSNPTLVQAQRAIDRSAQQAHQVSLPPNPTIGYSAEHIRGGSYHGGEEGAFLSQTFVLGRKLALRRDIFRAQKDANQFALQAQLARVHNDVASAFVDTLAAQASVMLQERLLKLALDSSTNTHELARIGQADASSILSAEITAEQAKVDLVEAQRVFLTHFARLATFAGQPMLEPHPLTGALVAPPDFDPEELVRRDTTESPEVKRAQASVTVAEAQLRSARREPIPNLTVKAGEWYSGEQLDGLTQKAGWMSFAEAGIQLPLWNRNQGNIAAAHAELSRAQHDVVRTQLWTRNAAEPFAQQYLAARFTADRYRTEMLPRARRAYQLEVIKYQQMAEIYPEVLTAQRLLYTLQVRYLQAVHDQWHAAIALSNYALSNALDQPMTTGDDSTSRNLPTAGSE